MDLRSLPLYAHLRGGEREREAVGRETLFEIDREMLQLTGRERQRHGEQENPWLRLTDRETLRLARRDTES